MSLPHSALAAGWVPFVIAVLLVLLFSFVNIRLYQSRHEKEIVSTLTAMLGLAVALITCALMPVDIFLVSYMKNSDGTFKEWAENNHTREAIENSVLYSYYALYSIVALFVFLLIPWAYFFYEESDEEASFRKKCCTAFKYTLVFLFAALILFLVGALVPFRRAPVIKANSTSWEDYFENIIHDLDGTQRWENSISFTISSLTVLGMLAMAFYTGYGVSAWPMDLVKGRRSTHRERQDVQQCRVQIQTQIDDLITRCSGSRMSVTDRRRLTDLEEKLEYGARRDRHLRATEGSRFKICWLLCRPVQISFGILFFVFAILVFVSLMFTNVDKILHSHGAKSGYALAEASLPNPIDTTLLFAQKVFPLDYVIMAAIIMYFFFCSMAALKQVGIWFCCLRMYKIRPRRTCPQGLLLLSYMLMLIVLALSVLVLQLAPQYAMFGSQKYIKTSAQTLSSSESSRSGPDIVQCSTKADTDQCVMTRFAMLTMRLCYKFWFFGACYFWISWGFLAMIVLGFIVSVIRKRRSAIEGEVDREDITDSDEELLTP